MSQTTNTSQTLYAGAPTRSSLLDTVLERTIQGGFDAEAFHVMDRRDSSMIEQEIMFGAGSSKFVYSFTLAGTNVTGVSAVGARELRAHYGGLRTRMVSSWRKIGSLFIFTSYPTAGQRQEIETKQIPDLRDDPDGYSVLMEISDIKTGNITVAEKFESARERKRDGTYFDRPHFATIAQAKAERNGLLSLIPQAVVLEWKMKMLDLGKDQVITRDVLDEKRSGVLQYAASKAVPIDRRALEALTFEQITGLSAAVRAGGLDQFKEAADALGVLARTTVAMQVAPHVAETLRETALAAKAAKAQATQPAASQAEAVATERATQATAKAKPEAAEASSRAKRLLGPSGPQEDAQQGPAPAVPQPKQEPPEAQAGAPAQAEPTTQPTRLYLVNEDGEMVAGGVFADATAYARALADLYEKTGEDWREALLDQNAEDVAIAVETPEAKAIINAIGQNNNPAEQAEPATLQSADPAEPDDFIPLQIPKRGQNQQDLRGYVALCVEQLEGEVDDARDVADWIKANAPIYSKLPVAARTAVEKAVADRKTALGIGVMPEAAQAPGIEPEQQEPARSADERRVDDFLSQIGACRNEHELRAFDSSVAFRTVMARWEREQPHLMKTLINAMRSRIATFKGAPAGTSSAPEFDTDPYAE